MSTIMFTLTKNDSAVFCPSKYNNTVFWNFFPFFGVINGMHKEVGQTVFAGYRTWCRFLLLDWGSEKTTPSEFLQ